MHRAAFATVPFADRRPRQFLTLVALLAANIFCSSASARPLKTNDKPGSPTVRWSETQPGCTFSTSEDGKYRYGLWSGDVGINFSPWLLF